MSCPVLRLYVHIKNGQLCSIIHGNPGHIEPTAPNKTSALLGLWLGKIKYACFFRRDAKGSSFFLFFFSTPLVVCSGQTSLPVLTSTIVFYPCLSPTMAFILYRSTRLYLVRQPILASPE
ncbi:hypothetical protein BCR43DRAFT_186097 [Syncephalastrum racemosum]|uniref:Uncharacterized protein n=1 Tax=Syncephalastrum racemosum TaxID=13706 RepID=A0A1X2HQJ0_SYNRA|nr:hypothetical protein BCR43DRAFT_186097 [Syncephalastrum racemosum]